MIPGLLLHPTYSPAPACTALVCKWRYWAVTACQASRCPHRWQREDAEDRAKRESVQPVDPHTRGRTGKGLRHG